MAITYRRTDIQTYIHTYRQTEPKYDIDVYNVINLPLEKVDDLLKIETFKKSYP